MNSIRHTQEQLYVTPKIGYVDCDAKFRSTPSYFISGQHFLETFTLLPKQPEPQTHGDYNRFCPQTANTTFATLWRTYLPQHIQQCLNLTMHFSLRHLAAKMLSQLYHNFISFPYFFPSDESCSINVNPLFHVAIKNPHKTFWHRTSSLSLSFIYLLLKRGSNQTHTPSLQFFLAKNNNNISSR